MATQPEELLGRQLGPYTLDRMIGQGGYAWVFAGHRPEGSAAVKVLKPRYSADAEFEHRFRNEASMAIDLQHPNIVHGQEVGASEGYTYLAMDFYPDSLASRLEREGPLAEPLLIRLAGDLAAGLAFAHEQGVIHRDVKVENVLLAEDGHAVLTDFGIARAVSGYASATGVNMTVGTPHYISPEQAQGRALDGRTDLYALGVTLYRAATGDLPFHSRDWFELARMHVEEQPEPPRKKRPELSHRFERIILKCLAKHPADRYPSALALHDELRMMADPGRRTSMFGIAPRSTVEIARQLAAAAGRPRWLLPTLAVLLVVVVALLVVVLGR